MNIIRLEDCDDYEQYPAWKESVRERVGVEWWEGPAWVGGKDLTRDAREFVVVGGVVYERRESKKKDYLNNVFFYADSPPGDKPEVLCPCGNFRFELHYGDYELIARCPECGRKESVYSG